MNPKDIADIEQDLKRNCDGYVLVAKLNAKSEVWKFFQLIRRNEEEIFGLCACKNCKKVYKYADFETKKAGGTQHLAAHIKSCKASNQPGKLKLTQTQKHDVKLSHADYVRLKRAEAKFIIKGSHSFRAIENEGLTDLCQILVDLAAKYGRFDVKSILHGRHAIKDEVLCLKTEAEGFD